ncbi:MAG: hypothetical protein IPO41_03965 [Acidobacteria bacterium]|nr:hypothetical protein [Acidobacteriota bacterium]
MSVSVGAFAQDGATPAPSPAPTARQNPVEPPAKPAVRYQRPDHVPPLPPRKMYSGDTYERSIAVSPNVNLTLCVAQGDLRINGWSRNEVRVYVKDGGNLKFNVREKCERDGKPNWVSPVPFDQKHSNKTYPDCIWGSYVEIDMPMSASIEIKGTGNRSDDRRYPKGLFQEYQRGHNRSQRQTA